MFKHLLLFFALSPLIACEQTPAYEPLADFTPPALRNVMFEIDTLNRLIEPILLDPAQTQTITSSVRSMQRWANDEAWQAYFNEPGFLGDQSLFNLYLSWLRAGLEHVARSAEKSDISEVRAGFILVQQSCIACHKRFNPNL